MAAPNVNGLAQPQQQGYIPYADWQAQQQAMNGPRAQQGQPGWLQGLYQIPFVGDFARATDQYGQFIGSQTQPNALIDTQISPDQYQQLLTLAQSGGVDPATFNAIMNGNVGPLAAQGMIQDIGRTQGQIGDVNTLYNQTVTPLTNTVNQLSGLVGGTTFDAQGNPTGMAQGNPNKILSDPEYGGLLQSARDTINSGYQSQVRNLNAMDPQLAGGFSGRGIDLLSSLGRQRDIALNQAQGSLYGDIAQRRDALQGQLGQQQGGLLQWKQGLQSQIPNANDVLGQSVGTKQANTGYNAQGWGTLGNTLQTGFNMGQTAMQAPIGAVNQLQSTLGPGGPFKKF